MPNKVITKLSKIWKDIAAAFVLVTFIVISIRFQYNLGILVGFLLLFIFCAFDRIKRIIFDMNVRKIFGIEFGEFKREQVMAKAALTEAINSLGPSSDLGKINQAITNLDPKATPAGTVEEAAQKLQKIVRETDPGAQTRMDIVTNEFQTAGILK
jgi:hypothetical protein